jgi:hypothetical protein
MVVSTKLAAAVMGGLLLAAVYTPAWAGSGDAGAQPATASASQSLVGVLNPVFANVATHPAQKTCKADTLYSNHDVVGDPDSCFQNKLDARAGSATGGSAVAGVL